MDIQTALTIAKTFPSVDIEADGQIIRKNIDSGTLDDTLLRSYFNAHGSLTIVPKKKNGNAPIRLVGSAIVVDDAGRSLAGYEPNYIPQPVSIPRGNDSGDLYRILYENSKEEARDYKRKYEDALNEKHKVELELAGNKNSFVGDIAQGLAGFAPMIMGGMGGGVGVGSVAPSAPQPLKPVTDTKLAAIIQYYNRLDAHDKDKVYNLLALVFGDLTLIDKFLTTN